MTSFNRNWKRWLALFMAIAMVMTSGIISTNQSLQAETVPTSGDTGTEKTVGTVKGTADESGTSEEIVEHSITYTIEPLGTATISDGAEKVEDSASLTFTVEPEEGYRIVSVTADGVALTPNDNSYSVAEVTKDMSIVVNTAAIEPDVAQLNVYYVYESDETTVAEPYVTQLTVGSTYEVNVPQIDGYEAQVEGTAAGSTIKGTLNKDTTIEVKYVASEKDYKVIHHFKKSDDVTDAKSFTENITSGKTGEMTDAQPKSFEGYDINNYDIQSYNQVQLAAGSDVTVDIIYTLKTTYLNYETNGGSYVARQSGRYSDTLDVTTTIPTKQGYTFAGWYTDAKLTVEAGEKVTLDDVNGVTLYAAWEAGEVSYTVNY